MGGFLKGVQYKTDEFIPEDGQVDFVLSQTPFNNAFIEMQVNGLTTDKFKFSNNNKLTYIGNFYYPLGKNDVVKVNYFTYIRNAT